MPLPPGAIDRNSSHFPKPENLPPAKCPGPQTDATMQQQAYQYVAQPGDVAGGGGGAGCQTAPHTLVPSVPFTPAGGKPAEQLGLFYFKPEKE